MSSTLALTFTFLVRGVNFVCVDHKIRLMRGLNLQHIKRRFQLAFERPKVQVFFVAVFGFHWPLIKVHLLIAMFYEIVISVGSVLFSFLLYFGFNKFFQSDNDDVVFDRRDDLDGKELLLVNVVRGIKLCHVRTRLVTRPVRQVNPNCEQSI